MIELKWYAVDWLINMIDHVSYLLHFANILNNNVRHPDVELSKSSWDKSYFVKIYFVGTKSVF